MAGLESEAVSLYETGEGELAAHEREALGKALYDGGRGVIAIKAGIAGEGVRFARSAEAGHAVSASFLERDTNGPALICYAGGAR